MRFSGLHALSGALLVVASMSMMPALADHHHHDWNHIDQNAAWEEQRDVYRHNWKRLRKEHQRELDAEMRAQWLAYHHNQWNGGYGWSQYNNPGFLDYLHTSNPGLLTRMSSYLGL
ncbi:MAG TPA: hypothetical protein V6C72_15770 [Chroococcales cyanobacterium]